MIWFGKKVTEPRKTARLINRAVCRVVFGRKVVNLTVDYCPEGDPEFVVFLPKNRSWDEPDGIPIAESAFVELENFIPLELLRRDGVKAVVKVVST